MRHTEFLIIGQGISGTFLSWYLHKNERSFIVMDDNDASSASRVAAGVINPVTGRRIAKTWMIETLLRFAQKAYAEIGDTLHISQVKLPKGAKPANADEDFTVATIVAPSAMKAEEEEAAAEGVVPTVVEEEAEGEGGEAAAEGGEEA